MIYIYAYSNHKYGLDRLRSMAVLCKEIEKLGLAVEMLTNDFRAASMARDLGVGTCTTVETIFDIDFVAERGDTLIIDSSEDDKGKLEIYVEIFENVYKIANHCDEKSQYGEQIWQLYSLVGEEYRYNEEKEQRALLFLGDSDADKWLLKKADFFKPFGFELLLGEYFYADYESDLENTFTKIHESEEYMGLVSSSQTVVTASIQTAHEAISAGANSIYINRDNLEECIKNSMLEIGISVVDLSDKKELQKAIKSKPNQTKKLPLQAEEVAKIIANK